MSGAYIVISTEIQFTDNYVEDVLGPMPRGQMIQFNEVFGKGNVIRNNIAINHWRRSHSEDVINLFKSSGAAGSPIVIQDNWIMGDPSVGSQDMSGSGSGIMLGDSGGANIVCQSNYLISPGQVGIGVASGSNIVVAGNIVLGRRSNVSNVGIYVWNESPRLGGQVRVVSNIVAWTNASGKNNAFWQGHAKHGKDFEFTEVWIQDNTWNAWDIIERAIGKPPAADRFPLSTQSRISHPQLCGGHYGAQVQ